MSRLIGMTIDVDVALLCMPGPLQSGLSFFPCLVVGLAVDFFVGCGSVGLVNQAGLKNSFSKKDMIL